MKYLIIIVAVIALLIILAMLNYRRFRGKPVNLIDNPYKTETRELCFENQGEKIYGQFLLPKGKSGKLPTVICSHGLNSSFGNTEYMVGKSLAKAGFAVYCYDFRGGSLRSKSGGDMNHMSVFTEQSDLLKVMDEVRKLPEIDTDNLFLFGESQGGFVTAVAADERPEGVKAIVLYYPAFCIPEDARKRYPDPKKLPEVPEKGLPLGRVYHEKLYDYDIFEHLAGFEGPVLIVHGELDPVAKLPDSRRAVEVYKNAQLKILPNQKHGFNPAGTEQAVRLTYDFLTKHLQ